MIVILVPSRGRPVRAERMAASVVGSATDWKDVRVELLVDPDDPELEAYQVLQWTRVLPEPMGYTRALNHRAAELELVDGLILGAFGDDVVFRTAGWDLALRAALERPGLAYGDDLIHGRNHPSAVFMSGAIYRALGWLALPATSHQWADDAWKQLGTAAGCLRFLEGVVFEHEHPAVGKAPWDATYDLVFQGPRAKADHAGFDGWHTGPEFERDVALVRSVL